MQDVAKADTDPDSRKDEMIRDHAPHPWELAGVVSHDYEHLDQGRWKIRARTGWNEDVVNALWMEGYLIRATETDAWGNIVHTVIEERLLETETCINCGERIEPGECPHCGADP